MAEAPRLEEAMEFAENSKRYLPQRHRERTPWRSSVRARRATLGPASGRSCAHAALESTPVRARRAWGHCGYAMAAWRWTGPADGVWEEKC